MKLVDFTFSVSLSSGAVCLHHGDSGERGSGEDHQHRGRSQNAGGAGVGEGGQETADQHPQHSQHDTSRYVKLTVHTIHFLKLTFS